MDTQLIAHTIRLKQMTEMVQQCRNSGLTCREWCKQNHVSEHVYFYWQRKAREALCENKTVEFAEIPAGHQDICSNCAQTGGPEITIKINGAAIEVCSSASASTLRMVLQELRNA